MRFDILTIFPEFFGALPSPGIDAQGILGHGVVSRALRTGLASAAIHDLRAFTHDRHRTVDDRPFGGGEGMVLKPQPIYEALESLNLSSKSTRQTTHPQRETVILLSAQGKRFTQSTARRLATLDRVVLLCGRYEGVDERVSQLFCDEELSIGDYVLSGGELAAAVLLDATVRLLPGVLGHADSSRYESFGEGDPTDITPENCHPEERRDEGPAPDVSDRPSPQLPPRSTNSSNGILDYPHYTRPAEFAGLKVPEPLLNGDHQAIRRWRREQQLRKTHANRPDLLAQAKSSGALSRKDLEFLESLSAQ